MQFCPCRSARWRVRLCWSRARNAPRSFSALLKRIDRGIVELDVKRTGADPIAIEAVYRQRFAAFVSSMTALLGDGEAARDVVQDAFALALTKRRSFRGDSNVETWLWRIVINAARDRNRVTRRRPANVHQDIAIAEDRENDESLRAQVLALPERQRLAVFLRYYGDLSYPQIAEVLGIRPGTVAASLSAAHNTLRRQLEEVSR